MSETYCPECGTKLEGATVCPKCGFDLAAAPPKPAKKASASGSKKSTGGDSTWNSLEEVISICGWLSWFLLIIAALLMILQVITSIGAGNTFLAILYILSSLFTVYTIFTYGRIYSKKCKEKDWKFLMTDTFTLGKFRIPKMLAFGVLLFFFAQGWGGFLVYATAFLIYFLSPEKGTHKWQ